MTVHEPNLGNRVRVCNRAADDYRGETVKAVVSLRPGIQADPDEIREFCKDRLAAYKYPRIVEIIDELPKTVTGKVLRRELRDNA